MFSFQDHGALTVKFLFYPDCLGSKVFSVNDRSAVYLNKPKVVNVSTQPERRRPINVVSIITAVQRFKCM